MKKYLIAAVLVAAFILYLVFGNKNSPQVATTQSGESTTTGPAATPTTTDEGQTTAPPTPAAVYNFTSNLGFGATGAQVSLLQQFLIDQNYLTAVSAPTGYFGSLTQTAVMAFQMTHGISSVNGYFDATTRAFVNRMDVAMNTTTPTVAAASNGSTGQYKDGIYTGSVANAFYGKLQAVVTIQGGMITDVTFPQAPSGGHSGDVSATALPQLKQEAIAAQSANVNVVSGATQDSEAFQQSLGAALAQAKS